MNRDLHPADGARLLLERGAFDESRGVYRATIFTPTESFGAECILVDDGTFTLGDTGAPAELHEAMQMLAKLTARAAGSRRDDGLDTWPARVLRWRGPGRGL